MLSLQATSFDHFGEKTHPHHKVEGPKWTFRGWNATTAEVDRGNSAINHNNNYY